MGSEPANDRETPDPSVTVSVSSTAAAAADGSPRTSVGGFTLVELLVVVMIAVITLGVAARSYEDYLERTATERAARIFARDLRLARMNAVQARVPVIVRFDEAARSYRVVVETGRVLASRRYGGEGDVALGGIDLELPGDSLVFDGRGLADLSGVGGSLGTATFRAGSETYTVSFNSMGASRVGGS